MPQINTATTALTFNPFAGIEVECREMNEAQKRLAQEAALWAARDIEKEEEHLDSPAPGFEGVRMRGVPPTVSHIKILGDCSPKNVEYVRRWGAAMARRGGYLQLILSWGEDFVLIEWSCWWQFPTPEGVIGGHLNYPWPEPREQILLTLANR